LKKIFYGRLNIQQAGSAFYFTKESVMQRMMVELKYRGNKNAGYLSSANCLGMQLADSDRFASVDAIVPLPLNPKKERKRGYNQAQLIAEGIQAEWDKPILSNAVARKTIYQYPNTKRPY